MFDAGHQNLKKFHQLRDAVQKISASNDTDIFICISATDETYKQDNVYYISHTIPEYVSNHPLLDESTLYELFDQDMSKIVKCILNRDVDIVEV